MIVKRKWETLADPNAATPCGGTAPKVVVGPPTENASLLTKEKRLRREMALWVRQGAKLVPSEVRRQRIGICKACSYFDPAGNWGLGQCRYPGCGCSTIKAALATSKCPHQPPKWPEWVNPLP